MCIRDSLGIELVAVYGLGLGIEGSAWSTVVAQYGAAAAYLALVLVSARRTRASLRPDAAGIRSTARIGSQVMVRTAALLIALLTTTALAARVSTNSVAAHQVCLLYTSDAA